MSMITGTAGNDSLSGTEGNDILVGGAGHDTIDGLGGADTASYVAAMAGYRFSLSAAGKVAVTDTDLVTGGNEGVDTLTSIEQLQFSDGLLTLNFGIGGYAVRISGDANSNFLAWSGPVGVALDGASGGDTLIGSAGNDDLVGGGGTDSMTGGAGDDAYDVDVTEDSVIETIGGGTDTVRSTASDYTLPVNLEVLLLAGIADINGTGNSEANNIRGNIGNNTLVGGGGNDVLYGGGGADILIGGTGDDLVYVDSADDVAMENPGEGTDTVASSATAYSLSAEFERLILLDEASAGTGNALANVITGNAANNALSGASGDDSLLGGGGDDILEGGEGNDTLDGQDGVNTASYVGAMAGYQFGVDGGHRITVSDVVRDTSEDEGVDTLLRIGQVQFSDGVIGLVQNTETQVNTLTARNQFMPIMSALSGGGYLVAWVSDGHDGDGTGIYFQQYDANQAKVGNETLVNTTVIGAQGAPAVTALADGGYVFAWQSSDQGSNRSNVYSQRFDGDGFKVGTETIINTATSGSQVQPAIAGLADGGFIVTWEVDGRNGGGTNLFAQRYFADGTEFDVESKITTTESAFLSPSAIATSTSGGHVLVWAAANYQFEWAVFAQCFDANGTATGGVSEVYRFAGGAQGVPEVTPLLDGDYLLTWAAPLPQGAGSGIYAVRLDGVGAKVGSVTLIHTPSLGNASSPAIDAMTDGGYFATWSSSRSGSGSETYGQRFDKFDVRVGNEVQINSTTISDQTSPAITVLEGGSYVVAWSSYLQDGWGSGIFFQRFDEQGRTVRLDGDAGANDIAWSASSGISIQALGGDDTIGGGPGNDLLDGGEGSDHLDGGAGNDQVLGGRGDDQLVGGAGENLLRGGDGSDVLDGAGGYSYADYSDAPSGVSAYLTWAAGNGGEAAGDHYVAIQGMVGTFAADILSGNELENSILSGDGNDWLFGREGQDALYGGAGNDVLSGGAGSTVNNYGGDLLDGGDGVDVAYYRDAPATVFLVSNVGFKEGLVDGRSYGISINVTDVVNNFGEAMGDALVDIENIWGSRFDDIIRGDNNVGGQIYGFEGNDILDGRGGDDVFYGGTGADTLTGGAGAEDFFYLSWNDHYNQYGTLEAYEGGDTITDFEHGIDQITVSRYWFGFGNIGGPAASLTSEHADFISSGTTAASTKPTFFWNAGTGVLLFDPDGTGDSQAVNIATLTNGATLTLGDIWTA